MELPCDRGRPPEGTAPTPATDDGETIPPAGDTAAEAFAAAAHRLTDPERPVIVRVRLALYLAGLRGALPDPVGAWKLARPSFERLLEELERMDIREPAQA